MTAPNVDSSEYAPDPLFAGPGLFLTKKVVLATGQVLARGAVLGAVSSGGKRKLSATAAGDGSQTPIEILVNDQDTTGGDKTVDVYYDDGTFNAAFLVIGTGHTVATVRDALQAKNLRVVESVSADDPADPS